MIPIPIPVGIDSDSDSDSSVSQNDLIQILIPIPASCDPDSNSDSKSDHASIPNLIQESDSDSVIIYNYDYCLFRILNLWYLWLHC